jgi:hypothetical protein
MFYLLAEKFNEHYSDKFPMFYKNKIQKKGDHGYFYRNAIESAFKSNQVGAVSKIIEYIVKFQNNLVSSFLFNDIFPTLLEKGVNIKPLLDS